MPTFTRNPAFMPAVRANIARRVLIAAQGVAGRTRDLIDTEGSGRKYKALPNRSSEAGEPPTSQSGELRDSIEAGDVQQQGALTTARAGSSLIKARFLEMGTKDMAPRPFLRPALDESRDQIIRDIANPALLEGTAK